MYESVWGLQRFCSQIKWHDKSSHLQNKDIQIDTSWFKPGKKIQYIFLAKAFDLRQPLLKDVRAVVKKVRSRSAPSPGLSGTSYKVYKHCPKLLLRLWRIFKDIWKRGKTAEISAEPIASECNRQEVGIITGYSISVILFTLPMNVLVQSSEPECNQVHDLPITNLGLHGPLNSDYRVSAWRQMDHAGAREADSQLR